MLPCKDHGRKGQGAGYAWQRTPTGRRPLHRLVLAAHLGIPELELVGVVRHQCDNPRCVEPTHLIQGTQADNMRDMVMRGRSCRGSRQHLNVLSTEDALWIKTNYIPYHPELGAKPLAARFGVSVSTISNIRRGKVWKYLPTGTATP